MHYHPRCFPLIGWVKLLVILIIGHVSVGRPYVDCLLLFRRPLSLGFILNSDYEYGYLLAVSDRSSVVQIEQMIKKNFYKILLMGPSAIFCFI